jgi:hypothetical protein
LNADEIFRPNKFAKQEVAKKIAQYGSNIPLISNIVLPTRTNVNV